MDPSCNFLPLTFLISIFLFTASVEGRGNVGVNYGMLGNNLPTPNKVVSLCETRKIDKIRLFDPNPDVLGALHGSRIGVVLGTLNQDLQPLAQDPSSAIDWVSVNVGPHARSVRFRYITVGNEVIPGSLANYVLPAMRNLDLALRVANLSIPVTTAVSTEVLGVSYPPSQGAFSTSSASIMTPIVSFLKSKGSPLLINVYPYFAYQSNPSSISLDYALFASPVIKVQDGPFGYKSLFDAMVDASYSALEKAGGPDVRVVVSETGWPSSGGTGASVENARMYNNNLVGHLKRNEGTPKRPGWRIEAYLFAMFNENEKPAGVEQNFGLFQPDMTEVYHVEF